MSKTRKYARNFDRSINDWRQLYTDADAKFDKVIKLDVTNLEPQVTWGTNPEMGVSFNTPFPKIKNINDERLSIYGLKTRPKAEDIDLGYVFLGSCTNARLSDLVEASRIVKGKQVHPKSLQSLYLALAQLKRS